MSKEYIVEPSGTCTLRGTTRVYGYNLRDKDGKTLFQSNQIGLCDKVAILLLDAYHQGVKDATV
jgi:hypothetical protein